MTLIDTDATQAQRCRDTLRLALQKQVRIDIPITDAMQVDIAAWDGDSLRMTAPLIPNLNDKGCAFGGSLASVMTLACWCLVRLAMEQRGLSCDIYVQDSSVRYLAPVWEDFSAEARLAYSNTFDEFFSTLDSRGKARLSAHCEVRLADGSIASSLNARFVALRRSATVDPTDGAQSETTG
ncbi:YiiD C-terminal domain-containing protein [Dokdonella sp.]|uniref:YiiD C-terminal domain-containing protein n=1 Tax=Dokdonella sp. TaxID=2291710 RepID=UPI003C4F13F9